MWRPELIPAQGVHSLTESRTNSALLAAFPQPGSTAAHQHCALTTPRFSHVSPNDRKVSP